MTRILLAWVCLCLIAAALIYLIGCMPHPRPTPHALTLPAPVCALGDAMPAPSGVCAGKFTKEKFACAVCVQNGCVDSLDMVYCVSGSCLDPLCLAP